MDIKKDIETREDITKLIIQFYEQVKKDSTIGFIFNEVVNMNWEVHIPIIVDFWETILLDNPVYKKNAMEIHYDLNKRIPLQQKHFSQWLLLFYSSVDNLFTGKTATLAKTRAKSIAAVMELKMSGAKSNILK
jgi:hemoglobin